jgi:hypothetical protein
MYSMAKSLGRERLRLNPLLVGPMTRLWHVALSLRETSTGKVKKTDTRHEVRSHF